MTINELQFLRKQLSLCTNYLEFGSGYYSTSITLQNNTLKGDYQNY